MNETLPITDESADLSYRQLLVGMSIDPGEPFAENYTNYEWNHARYIFQQSLGYLGDLAGKHVLEFGCHLGGTAVILAKMGAVVTAVDINPSYCAATEANAARYGVSECVRVRHVADTRHMPFEDERFDVVSCNSVLEYVPHEMLPAIQKEIHRVLKRRCLLFIIGTSNRWWPREVHSRQWGSNYVPRPLDWLLDGNRRLRRGVSPLCLRFGFGRYEDVGRLDKGRSFVEAKRRMGWPSIRLLSASVLGRCLAPLGVSLGMLMPSSCLVLRKQSWPPSSPDPRTGQLAGDD